MKRKVQTISQRRLLISLPNHVSDYWTGEVVNTNWCIIFSVKGLQEHGPNALTPPPTTPEWVKFCRLVISRIFKFFKPVCKKLESFFKPVCKKLVSLFNFSADGQKTFTIPSWMRKSCGRENVFLISGEGWERETQCFFEGLLDEKEIKRFPPQMPLFWLLPAPLAWSCSLLPRLWHPGWPGHF